MYFDWVYNNYAEMQFLSQVQRARPGIEPGGSYIVRRVRRGGGICLERSWIKIALFR
jgi:hypothetical protein